LAAPHPAPSADGTLSTLAIRAGDAFRPGQEPAAPTGVLRGVADGASALRAHPQALWLVGADVMCSLVYGMQTVLLIGVAERAGLGVHGYGYLFAGIGIGGLVGTGLAGRAMRFPRPRVILLAAMAAVGLPMLLLAVTPSAPAAIILVGLTGVGAILVEISTETVLQRTLPPEMFGRAYGLAIPAAIAGIVIGSLIAPALTSVVGGTGALVACGGAAMGYAALVLASATADRRRQARRHAGRALHRRLLAEL
jgi:predicted MFS family arabinose efflux permease